MANAESLKRYKRKYGAAPAHRAKDEDPKKTIRQLEQTLTDTNAKLRAETKRADTAEDLKESVFGITLQTLPVVRWPAVKRTKGRSSHTPILFTSDFQFGEVVSASEIDGMNSFNADIFAARYTKMLDTTALYASAIEDGFRADYPGIVYLRGGDAISGEIHAELSETNDFGAVPQVRKLVSLEAEGIRRLKERFGRVRVISIPGNHGRTTFKPRSKKYADTNYETLIAWWLQSSFEKDPAIEFVTPESGDAFFEAEGWRFLLSHGDRMGSRGGTGFIGPIATIGRGHQKLRMNAAASGRPVDFVLTGHLHTSVKTEWGWANGSIVGYNEYARDLRCEPDCAKQWLFFVHREKRVAHAVELQLSDFPKRS